jgi:KDO2-lipid IV(A) lauroyltransferase
MIVMVCTRQNHTGRSAGATWQYEIQCDDLILPEEYKDRSDAVPAMTQRFTTALERMIRRHPEQYFWLHRRWKHQPKSRNKSKPAQAA